MSEDKTSTNEDETQESLDEETEETTEEKTPEIKSKKSSKLKAALAQKEHWRKKAQELQEAKEEKATPKVELSQDDLYALMEGKVPKEDVSDVKDYAAIKKISVVEALDSDVIKTILKTRAEQRKTAEASNTGGGKRSTRKVTGETLLQDAEEKGIFPESTEDMTRLAEARLQRQKASTRHE